MRVNIKIGVIKILSCIGCKKRENFCTPDRVLMQEGDDVFSPDHAPEEYKGYHYMCVCPDWYKTKDHEIWRNEIVDYKGIYVDDFLNWVKGEEQRNTPRKLLGKAFLRYFELDDLITERIGG